MQPGQTARNCATRTVTKDDAVERGNYCLAIPNKNTMQPNVSRAMIKVQPERQGDMDETKQEPSTNSRELTDTAVAERQAEAKEIAESLTGKAAAEPKKPSRYSPVTVSPESAQGESSPVQEFVEFLKQTKRIWLMAVGT